jgi:hypothetical protein
MPTKYVALDTFNLYVSVWMCVRYKQILVKFKLTKDDEISFCTGALQRETNINIPVVKSDSWEQCAHSPTETKGVRVLHPAIIN